LNSPIQCNITHGPAATGQNPTLVNFALANAAGMFHFYLAGYFFCFAGAAGATAARRGKAQTRSNRCLQNSLIGTA
jgi:hypothetical protein